MSPCIVIRENMLGMSMGPRGAGGEGLGEVFLFRATRVPCPPMPFERDEVRTYRLDPAKLHGAIAESEQRARRFCIVLAPVLLACSLGPFAFAAKGGQSSAMVLPAMIGVALALGIPVFVYARAKQAARAELQRNWDAYHLVVSANALRYADGVTFPVEIVRPEITRISEQLEVGLTIATKEAGRFLFLPATLGGYGDLRAHLDSWRGIEGKEPWTTVYGRIGWFWAQIVLAVCSWAIPDLRISAVCALAAVVAGVLAIRQMRAIAAASEEQKVGMVRAAGYFLFATVGKLLLAVMVAWLGAPGGPTHGAP